MIMPKYVRNFETDFSILVSQAHGHSRDINIPLDFFHHHLPYQDSFKDGKAAEGDILTGVMVVFEGRFEDQTELGRCGSGGYTFIR